MTSENPSVHTWSPLRIFDASSSIATANTALVILNQPIDHDNESKLIHLWHNSSLRICVDGGTNRLHDWCHRQANNANNNNNNNNEFLNTFIPDYICGDLDSVDSATRAFYTTKGTRCLQLADQCATDFTKTLRFIANCIVRNDETYRSQLCAENNDKDLVESIQSLPIENVYCLCGFGGRLDHAMSNLSTLYDGQLRELRTYIVSGESVTFLLAAGSNVIDVASERHRGKYCGFFPLDGPSVVSTRGFRWNVRRGQAMRFGEFVSSSNEFCWDEGGDGVVVGRVEVETERPLVFTMSIEA